MKKLVYSLIAGLSFLASVSLADVDFSIIRNKEIVQVANKKAVNNNYAGDVFFHYRKTDDKWALDKLTYLGNGRIQRKYIKEVSKEEIPTYIKGFYSLYYDPDQNEECLVAIFEENIDSKVKEAWIELAKKHIEELNGD